MNNKIKKYILIVLAVAGFAAIAMFTLSVLKYNQVKNAGVEIKNPVFTLTPSKDIKLGSTISVDGIIECPWHRWPVKADVTPGKGSQTAGNPEIKYAGIGWGSWKWNVSDKIQPYQNGNIDEGTVVVELNNPRPSDKQRSLASKIPSFESAALETGTSPELAVAGSITKKVLSGKLIILLSVIAMLAIVFLFIWLRRKKKNINKTVIPAWDIALMEFGKLRRELKEHRLTPDICIVKLTDIIRNYLEKRFSLHAPTQTTVEFMEDLKRDRSPLKSEDRDFLKDFLTAADLVKFANLPADELVIENAISKAEALVKTTRPAETADGRQSSVVSGQSKVDNSKQQ
ncbi:MAG TPA: hypothetical protein DET40_08490 [Lentisphaeria bacterium]|nr:MAG: hypothetical protein A2X45_12090 [Lentisphaerae bacterium GWF2_50_93]HCE43572.1 hypothetical protein [Lentisphaeria bacterium]